jgi:dTDP-glucose 4,6-dehydratase
MKILITGGAGFIGSALIRYVINNSLYSIVNIDKLSYASNLESLEGISKNSRYTFRKVDICNPNLVKSILTQYQPNIIINLAAETHVDRSITNPHVFIKNNIIGTYILLEQTRIYWSQLEGKNKLNFRFHHVSTDEVFGDLQDHNKKTSPKKPFFSEKSAYKPSSPYSASKAASDHLVRAWHRTYNLPTIVTNCSNNYGPYQFPEKLIPLITLNAIKGKLLPVYGNGHQIRDWLYVDDHAEALLLLATKGKIGETYNIGGNNVKKNIDVINLICKILNNLLPIKKNKNIKKSKSNLNGYENLITFVEDRAGHDIHYAINANKIKKEFNWRPKQNFTTGIFKTIQWYLSNLDWCERMQKKNSKIKY